MSSTTLRGNGVVPGIGIGPVVRPGARTAPPEHEDPVTPEAGAEQFSAAAGIVADRLAARAQRASGASAEVLMATSSLARDRGLAALVQQRLTAGQGPSGATAGAIEELSAMFAAAGGLMAERVTDLRDVRDRIVAELLGLPEPGIPTPDGPAVLCADDLAPADTAGLDPAVIVAIATSLGGATSHTAIIARQLGIPCVVAIDGLDDVREGAAVLVDGSRGELVVDPDPAMAAERTAAATAAGRAAASWLGPGATRDGHGVDILANVQDGPGARRAAETPVQGVGLFRTELCFLDRDVEPTVDQQAAIYAEVLAAMGDRKVVVRTLDAGSDKPVSFATIKDEPNPALGVRGMRLGLRDEGLMDRQLDAIALAAKEASGPVWVMAPMVATEDEAQWFAEKVRVRDLVPGVMIEIPSAALLADRILRHVDFVSIGTNDLSQYAFAADRMAPSLARLTDPWQPALLALIQRVADAGRAAGKPVGVCGEAAADPQLGCVLVGLGVSSLSAAATAAPLVGATLAGVTLDACRAAAQAALDAASPDEARRAAAEQLT
ncbi:phosphoenolpyruvate--protein phosphotransferase [Aeromicrobium chenweiae]|uniref:Phosphoenolpyruvate-protein phosphotransferase n=1 Tax=Aeromicrobium chenweiae TaxID=2079793 RepID=A0A2S0WKA9_9ACTN|nr:putative PEP-binding protein [Aeromicrobium chenweiae]AWB91704.1 phosphoenolpyruvate--protein phosphotransferase [Aeromicrobium chenweiae]TGN32545.1 phosphoenolpyruvate--protein phosphotransferase [Aeromicrobium chenweiae]